MTASPFHIEIDDEPSACKSLRRLLCSVPMDAEAYSTCERVFHAAMPCKPGCLVVDRVLPGQIRDVSRSKGSALVLLCGSLVAFTLIALGFFANHAEDLARPTIAVTPAASDADWIAGTDVTHDERRELR